MTQSLHQQFLPAEAVMLPLPRRFQRRLLAAKTPKLLAMEVISDADLPALDAGRRYGTLPAELHRRVTHGTLEVMQRDQYPNATVHMPPAAYIMPERWRTLIGTHRPAIETYLDTEYPGWRDHVNLDTLLDSRTLKDPAGMSAMVTCTAVLERIQPDDVAAAPLNAIQQMMLMVTPAR